MVAYHPSHGPVVLCIMDGWGHRAEPEHNAVALAETPVFDMLMATQPHSFLAASGVDVGLPDGQVGNSEVGHMNIGAGRVVMQDLPRLNAAVKDGSLAAHPDLIVATRPTARCLAKSLLRIPRHSRLREPRLSGLESSMQADCLARSRVVR